jgi:cystathionine beta-lyase/cystathionine gamma-synthase
MDNTHAASTHCVHAGSIEDSLYHGTVSPIYPATAYDYEGAEGTAYPRYFNTPNQKAIVQKLCALEKGEAGLVTSSGMSAIMTVLLSFLKSGDHAIFQEDLYGGTMDAIAVELEKFGISYTLVSAEDPAKFEQAILPSTKLIYIETPSNPLLRITDVEAVATIAKKHGLLSVIDNTFASPINQQPLTMGIDIVTHSATKYLGGHSDISAGAIITSQALFPAIWNAAIHFGGNLNMFTCYLLERSIKTLALRVGQQNVNALALATYLQAHPKIKAVHYPGLESHPQHGLAKRQMQGFGGMLAFELAEPNAEFVEKLTLVKRAISLGGVESTICSPAKTSHARISAEERAKAGITDGVWRFSVGIEEAKDLMDDFAQALG